MVLCARSCTSLSAFRCASRLRYPPSLAERRITNPDAPLVDCVITLPAADGQTHTFAPVLYASEKDYDAKKAPCLFQSLLFRLMLVEKESAAGSRCSRAANQLSSIRKKSRRSLEKIGQNTNYIIHPDEILADNFVHLVMDDQRFGRRRGSFRKCRQALK